ncbi:MAG TPA: hypothetical protein VI485_07040 [Vicinamibacterales bacterium]|nr:hypothetical protein [Vicinamibacterales bacterium]
MKRWTTILLPLALVAAPAIAITVLAASGVAALVRGQPLIWPAQTVTLTEAVGMHDAAEVVRQIALGANPNARYDAWDILKRFQHVSVTPLEAAVATRELYMFDLIVAEGALLTPDNARTLQCFAAQERATEIAAWLAERFPRPESCEGVTLPW